MWKSRGEALIAVSPLNAADWRAGNLRQNAAWKGKQMKNIFTNYRIDVYGNACAASPATHDIHLLCAVDGSAIVTVNGQPVNLNKMDLLLVNSGDACEIRTAENSMLAAVSLDYYIGGVCSLHSLSSVECAGTLL